MSRCSEKPGRPNEVQHFAFIQAAVGPSVFGQAGALFRSCGVHTRKHSDALPFQMTSALLKSSMTSTASMRLKLGERQRETEEKVACRTLCHVSVHEAVI